MSNRTPQILPICIFGDPVLRKKAEPVGEITEEIRDFIADMIATLASSSTGIGLAAPQVGRSLRIFLSTVTGETDDGELIIGPVRVFINPQLSSPSEEGDILPERCLSLPGLQGDVLRPLGIVVDALDIDGAPFREELYGFAARVIMHENDHLNGTFFFDRMDKKERRLLEPALARLRKSR